MNTQKYSTKDCWIGTGQGRLRARCWQPLNSSGDLGSQSPVVLFHDSLGCINLWRTFPAALVEHTGRQVVAYDRLGFGQSDRRTDELGSDFVRDEAARFFPALREQLGFDRFIAFGHSVGGGMAIHCAADYAAECEALVTESAQVFVEDRTRAGILNAKELFQQREPFERLKQYHGEKTRWVLDAWIDTWLSPEFSDWTLEGVLPKVRCPILAIHGDEDEYGSTVHPKIIARLAGGSTQTEIMSGIRHVPHREQERRVAERVASFIAEST